MTTTTRQAPEQYKVSVLRPADFDTFWRRLLDESSRIPLNLTLEYDHLRSSADVEVFQVHYDSLDSVRIAGWYARPAASRLAPPYPGLIIVPGYISEPKIPKDWARLGYAAFSVAPRGKLRSNSQFNPGYPGLLTRNIVDRNTYSYRGFYIDGVRAVDAVRELPEIDNERIGVHGSSQGGALTVVLAALRSDWIACAAAGAPYLTAFMDAARLTHSYPYEEINEYLRMYPDRREQVRSTLTYFDCINFAPLVSCPTLLYIGLEDDVCPPETGYALKQALRNCDLTFHAHERCAHDAGIRWEMAEIEAFLAGYLQPAVRMRVSGND